jgi:predicted lipase
LRSKLVPVNARFRMRPPFVFSTISGRLHSGFAEEATRISTRVLDAIRDSNLGDVDHVFLTGHSLGGAVAAIAENFVKVAPTSVCIFGAPQ